MLSFKQNVLIFSRLLLIAFAVTTLIFSSCSYKQNQLLFEQTNAVPDSVHQKIRANVASYRIQPQDILQIKNVQQSKNLVDLSAGNPVNTAQSALVQQGESYEVEEDGTLALTGIGRIKVAGLTRIEARKLIEELYNKKFLNDALFDVKITNLKVTVFGEVKAPGNYQLIKDKTKLIDILGQAGGLTDKADEKHVKIVRGDKNNPEIIVVDLSKVSSVYDEATVLNSEDVIYVAQNKTATRTEKVQNLSVIVQPILLLLNTTLIILTLAKR